MSSANSISGLDTGDPRLLSSANVAKEPIPPVPEPSTLLLGLVALGGIIGRQIARRFRIYVERSPNGE